MTCKGCAFPALYYGDCFELLQGMPDESVDLFVLDPPYGISFASGRRKEKYEKIAGDDNTCFLPRLVDETFRTLRNNSACFVFCSWHHVDLFKKEFEKRFRIKSLIVWCKNAHGSGDLAGAFAPRHELILFCTKGRPVLRGKRPEDVLFFNRTGNKLHPTQKPVDLLSFLIRCASDPGDVVCDMFMGSGSTGVACAESGRRFVGCEIDEKYFQTALRRIEEAFQGCPEVG